MCSSAMTATAPASWAIFACSALVTSMMTPPLSISARPTLWREQLVDPGSVENVSIDLILLGQACASRGSAPRSSGPFGPPKLITGTAAGKPRRRPTGFPDFSFPATGRKHDLQDCARSRRPVSMQHRQGFTLIELMIVVVIIGLLASMAIPNFISMQDRAREARVKSHAHALEPAEDFAVRNDGVYSDAAADVQPLLPGAALLTNAYTGADSEPQFGAAARGRADWDHRHPAGWRARRLHDQRHGARR